VKIAYWGGELAEEGGCALCGKEATGEDDLAFLLPVTAAKFKTEVNWSSDVFAAVCESCFTKNPRPV